MSGVKSLSGDKWYYHPDHDAKLAWREDEEQHYAEGWRDTPDDFPVVRPLEDMTKDELKAIGAECGLNLKKTMKKETMIKAIQGAE